MKTGAMLAATWIAAAVPALAQPKADKGRAASDEERATMETADKLSPSVVSIQPVWDDYDSGVKHEETGEGSGVIIDPEGHVVTNFHVAGHAKKLIVTLWNKEKIGADLVGGDAYTDLAVIKLHLDELKATNLTWASLGDSEQVQVGQSVLAIGSPLGLKQTATKGIVSNAERFFSGEFRLPSGERTGAFNTWIQTDAPLNPGNSGGPLVNNRGEVIGINSRSAGADGLGFAVPINIAKDVAEKLIKQGKVVRSWIGVELQPMEDFTEFFKAEGGEGVLVSSVVKDSPADRAGVKTGDVLLEWDGKKTSARFASDVPAVRRLMADTAPGGEVQLRLLRGGKEVRVKATTESLEPEIGEEFECRSWRCSVRGMTRYLALARKMSTTAGVLVMGVDEAGPANRSDLRFGDVILKFDGEPVAGLDEFKKKFQASVDAKKPTVLLAVQRGKAQNLVVLENDYKRE
ncbi:MAG: trypsin-like peptidase domain-containing protein [Planctomycetes bacterium]|nr:trypsin-like peptidase domain-containing protein [Planctomycetota bacterium]MBI3845603.1 trypsin-like peptidase domain-containing protein [Planctomycetota bacterium]